MCYVKHWRVANRCWQYGDKAVPWAENQREYEHALKDHQKVYVVCTGPAGTGKTLLAVREGLSRLQRGTIEKIIFTRPAR